MTDQLRCSADTESDPFRRAEVEAICRAVCKVDDVDPDDDQFPENCDPAWTRYADAVFAALVPNEPQEVLVREALDNSQSLLVMILHLAEEYAMFSDRDMSGISKEDWAREGLTKLLTDQIVENRRTLSLPRPDGGSK